MNEWTSTVESCFLPVGRENLGVWVLICYGQPSWFFTCNAVWAKMKWPFVVREMIANAQQRKKTWDKHLEVFLERASISNFSCATDQINPRKYVSYDWSHLLQPCGKLLSWASAIPLWNFYPLAPPLPRNFHQPSEGGYGYFLESHIKSRLCCITNQGWVI